MNTRVLVTSLIFFWTLFSFSQEELYTSLSIPSELKANANAVIRLDAVKVLLNSSSNMDVDYTRIITVLNKQGDDNVDAYAYYDESIKIKELQAVIYDAFGKQIKKIKKNNFKDVSAVSGITLYSDSRIKYLDYTPISYPYTVVFTVKLNNDNTAFIRPFRPIDGYFVSTEKSTYDISFNPYLKLRTKVKNFEAYNLSETKLSNRITYAVDHIAAIKPEMYGPSFFDLCPKVLFASKYFALEGVESVAETWKDFGKWVYNDLLKDTNDLPASTASAIREYVKDESTDLAKAKKVYQFVQDKTRYISVQVGIGGWKPFNTSDVDKLGYGDCKGLTNYTKALLEAVGVTSNYVLVYSKSTQRDFEPDFASMQGDHAILNIPIEGKDIWLECTSQKLPFGFIGDFTDDRDVLVVSPNGGEIKHTKKYETEESLQVIKGVYDITNEGDINASATCKSRGIQYDNKYWLEDETPRDLDKHYKERWGYINGLTINNMAIKNDKNKIEFIEQIDFDATNYSKILGDRMLLPVNVFNRNRRIPDKYRNRELPIKIKRGFTDIDEIEIKLPPNYIVEALPQKRLVENKFGVYNAEVTLKDNKTLVYKRKFIVRDGEFPKEDYNKFRDFYKTVSRYDNTKIALIKN